MIGDWFRDRKPVIAMAHVGPLPGTPLFDEVGGIDKLSDDLARDVKILLDGGVDGILFCNEGDRPYVLSSPFEVVATMAALVRTHRPTDRPFGVDLLWDPMATMAVAAATGANFIREIVTGVYESDMGIWQPDAAALYRYRRTIGATDVRVFANVTPEFASPLGDRSAVARARSAATSSLVDAILIAGSRAGAAPERALVAAVHQEMRGEVPVLINTGATAARIAEDLMVCDGVIVGSSLKVDGGTWNPVDPGRVREFMKAVRATRTA